MSLYSNLHAVCHRVNNSFIATSAGIFKLLVQTNFRSVSQGKEFADFPRAQGSRRVLLYPKSSGHEPVVANFLNIL